MYRMSAIIRTCKFPIPYWLQKNGVGKGSVAYFVYGRFQPGHVGHKVVFNRLTKEAEEKNTSDLLWVDRPGSQTRASNVFVFVSQKQNKPRIRKGPCGEDEVSGVSTCENPLDPDTKVDLLQKQNPQPSSLNEPHIHFIKMSNINAGISMLLDCYEKVVMFVGEDRVGPDGFDKLKKYWDGGRLEVESAGERDETLGNIQGMSSSKIRRHAVNIKSFDVGDKDYEFVKDNLGVDKVTLDNIINKIKAVYIKKVGGRRRKKKTRRKKTRRKKKTRRRTRNRSANTRSRKKHKGKHTRRTKKKN
jgi:hypothetical protein